MSRNDGNQALHQDALGSIVATTDASGALKSETIYDAFGNITQQSGSSANKFGYTGHQMDAETGPMIKQIIPTESGIVSDEVAKLLKLNGLSANSWRGRNVSDFARYTKDGTQVVVRIIDKEGGSTFSHFVVVDGVTTRGGKSVVSIRDPHGIQDHSSVSTFERNFTGEVIVPRK